MSELSLIDGNPRWQRVQELAMLFQLIDFDNPKASVNMGSVNCSLEENRCGSPACHAGWFGVYFDNFNDDKVNGGDRYKSFSEYAGEMANFLGLECKFYLESWAVDNPEIWGNSDGTNMFYENKAFGISNYHNITLRDISNHWFKVAKRLYRIQE